MGQTVMRQAWLPVGARIWASNLRVSTPGDRDTTAQAPRCTVPPQQHRAAHVQQRGTRRLVALDVAVAESETNSERKAHEWGNDLSRNKLKHCKREEGKGSSGCKKQSRRPRSNKGGSAAVPSSCPSARQRGERSVTHSVPRVGRETVTHCFQEQSICSTRTTTSSATYSTTLSMSGLTQAQAVK